MMDLGVFGWTTKCAGGKRKIMLKQVVVFGSKIGEKIIGDMIEDNLPVDVIRVTSNSEDDYIGSTESEIRDLAETKLEPYLEKVDVIVFCEPEIMLSAGAYLKRQYPAQKFVGYGRNLTRLLNKAKTARVLLSHITKRNTHYQEMKFACPEVSVSESILEPFNLSLPKSDMARQFIQRILDGVNCGLVIIYTPDLIYLEDQIKDFLKWRANVVDMRDSLFRETCSALEFRGVDGRPARDVI